MRKFKFFIVLMMSLFVFAACDEDKIITTEQLPEAAKAYIQKSYPGIGVTYAKKSSELFKTKYEVRLDNGLEIEFDSDGAPVDIDADD
ncbi:MAG: PepSY-like domain-containing protein [Prevotella sp.]|jgi:Protein of unknown function (DUF2874).|nr:PepSY-like domain-containing protein [Prevotella sp.]